MAQDFPATDEHIIRRSSPFYTSGHYPSPRAVRAFIIGRIEKHERRKPRVSGTRLGPISR